MLKKLHIETPLLQHQRLSVEMDKEILLKMDCYQPSGSFKIRGIGHLCQTSGQKKCNGLLSSSGGNAGLAAAYAGMHLGLPTTIIVPTTTPLSVRQKIMDLKGNVIEYGSVWDESDAFARKYAEKHQLEYIHPFDHPLIWDGHATLIDELTQQCEQPDLIICSVGGGGLLCGIINGLQRNNWSQVPVLAVETYGADSFYQSVNTGALVELPAITSVAKTLGARVVAAQSLYWSQNHLIDCIRVTDSAAIKGCIDLANDCRVLVEPACGAAFASLYTETVRASQAKRIVVIICGGSGVNLSLIAKWQKQLTSPSS